jgi:hypothetical protein
MPEDGEELVNTHWHIGIAGRDEELLAYAAYLDCHRGMAVSRHIISQAHDPVMVSLWDAGSRIVFQAPIAAIAYMRRADATRKIDRNAPPSQVRDLGDELRRAAEPVECFNCAEAGEPGAGYPAGIAR